MKKTLYYEIIGCLVTLREKHLASRFVKGRYLKTIKVGNWVTEIFKNPSKSEFKSILGNAKGIRGVIENGDLIVWSPSISEETFGEEISHGIMVHQNKWRKYIPIILHRDKIEFSSWSYRNSSLKGDPQNIIMQNKYIKALGYRKYTSDE